MGRVYKKEDGCDDMGKLTWSLQLGFILIKGLAIGNEGGVDAAP